MHKGRAVFQCGLYVSHHRQGLIVDIDHIQGVFHAVAVVYYHGGHRLAHIANNVASHSPMLRCLYVWWDYPGNSEWRALALAHLLTRYHGVHPLLAFKLARINISDLRVGIRAMQD